MSEPVIVIGAGGHACVLLDVLQQQNVQILGLVDEDETLHGTKLLGALVLGGDEVVQRYRPDEVLLINAIGSIRQPVSRQRIYERFKSLGYRFMTVIHPSAVVSPHAALAEGAQIMAGVVVQAGTLIGENAIVNTSASVDHDCTVGRHAHLSPRTTLCGNVRIGEVTHIGAGATVIQGVVIGRSVLVGAGALVLQEVPDNGTALGVPARLRKR